MKKKTLISMALALATTATATVSVILLKPDNNETNNAPLTPETVYAQAQSLGFEGSLEDFLALCKGETGKSAYEIALENGFEGNLEAWLDSLHGQNGQDGEDGENGLNGQDGASIESVLKTDSNGNIDTYTITLTNGNTTTFSVTNGVDGTNGTDGKEIVSISKSASSGVIDTYKITFSDDTYQFMLENMLRKNDLKLLNSVWYVRPAPFLCELSRKFVYWSAECEKIFRRNAPDLSSFISMSRSPTTSFCEPELYCLFPMFPFTTTLLLNNCVDTATSNMSLPLSLGWYFMPRSRGMSSFWNMLLSWFAMISVTLE